MLDLKYRYLKPDMLPPGKYILAKCIKDCGLQEFEKDKKFQLLILVVHTHTEYNGSSPFHDFDNQIFQLVLDYKNRKKIVGVREKKSLEGVLFCIRSQPFVRNRKEIFKFFWFFNVEYPVYKQKTLLNDAVCYSELKEENQ